MTAHEKLAYLLSGTDFAEPVGSPAWWQSRSLEELDEFVERGIAGGEMFFAACTEIERREKCAEADRLALAAEAARRFRLQKLALLAGGLLLVIGAIAVALDGR